eukprot:4097641-Prymnesium_polylepis.1
MRNCDILVTLGGTTSGQAPAPRSSEVKPYARTPCGGDPGSVRSHTSINKRFARRLAGSRRSFWKG